MYTHTYTYGSNFILYPYSLFGHPVGNLETLSNISFEHIHCILDHCWGGGGNCILLPRKPNFPTDLQILNIDGISCVNVNIVLLVTCILYLCYS